MKKIYIGTNEIVDLYANYEEIENISKKEVISLIDKGLQSSSQVQAFIYSREFFEDDDLSMIFHQGEYKDLTKFINLSKYKETKFEFTVLRNTEEYLWGYFLEEGNVENKVTYVVIDRLSGKVKSLNNNLLHLVIYLNNIYDFKLRKYGKTVDKH